MTLEQAMAFFMFSVAAAGTPGPSNALLIATGANVGVRRGLPCLFGVAIGMGLMMFVVAFGLGTVILRNPVVLNGVKWCGAAVLGWLAWKIATAGHGDTVGGPPVGLLGAAAFQWINPKSWLCAPARPRPFDKGRQRAGPVRRLGLTFVLASLPSCFPWLAFGAVLQRVLHGERARRIFNGVMGALLAASVILIIR
jgi:threonine/homoserine/homoserine lactone efflux protein